MAFLESRPLDCVALGAQGGPQFSTGIVAVRSGAESRNQNWTQARHRYEVGMVARPLSQFTALKDAFMIVGGRANGFRFKDVGDYTVLSSVGDPQPLHDTLQVGTAGAGYGVPSYQLRKLYTYGAGSHLRDIRKPVAGTLVLRRASVQVTAGAAPGNYAIDTTTGIITFVADQDETIASHAVGASHQFTLTAPFSPNLAIGGRIYVLGVTGTAADLLNGLSHQITGVAGAVITTNTVTTGLTAANGTAYFYPQPTEALDFSCEFDVPVRFDTDYFEATIVDRAGSAGELLFQLPSVPLVEIKIDDL
jgi:uncharacterized protein (TIGR02217 family)